MPVIISGLEKLQNAGREQMIDLMRARMEVAEDTMANMISEALYSDGSGYGGKQLEGLDAAISTNPASEYGTIDGTSNLFWRNEYSDQTSAALDPTAILGHWNTLWAKLVRGSDRPDMILCDATTWNAYVNALQANQRFTNTNSADGGFTSLKFMDADVILDGGIYFGDSNFLGAGGAGGAPAGTAFFLNTKYLHYRPHAQCNMVPLSPGKRTAINQDAEVSIIGFAGNLTCSGRRFQGRLDCND